MDVPIYIFDILLYHYIYLCITFYDPSALVGFWSSVLSRRLKCTIVIMRCPSSVVRRKFFTFSTSTLKPLNGIQRNLTGSKISTTSIICVFRADRKNKMAALASYWLKHFRPPLNGIQRNLTESKISTSSSTFVFFGPIEKRRWPSWLLIGLDIFVSSETAERNSTKLDKKQDLDVLNQVCVFRADRKTRWPPGLWFAKTLSTSLLKMLNRISTKLDRKQDHNVLYKVCFSGQSEKQDGRPVRYVNQGGTLCSDARYVALAPLFCWIGKETIR